MKNKTTKSKQKFSGLCISLSPILSSAFTVANWISTTKSLSCGLHFKTICFLCDPLDPVRCPLFYHQNNPVPVTFNWFLIQWSLCSLGTDEGLHILKTSSPWFMAFLFPGPSFLCACHWNLGVSWGSVHRPLCFPFSMVSHVMSPPCWSLSSHTSIPELSPILDLSTQVLLEHLQLDVLQTWEINLLIFSSANPSLPIDLDAQINNLGETLSPSLSFVPKLYKFHFLKIYQDHLFTTPLHYPALHTSPFPFTKTLQWPMSSCLHLTVSNLSSRETSLNLSCHFSTYISVVAHL